MQIQINELDKALTQYVYQERITDIVDTIKSSERLFNSLAQYIDLTHFNKLSIFCDNFNLTDHSILIQQASKAFWIVDTFKQVTFNQNSDNEYYGELLFECVDIFDLSPLEAINLRWSTIFYLMTIDRLHLLNKLLIEGISLEKALDGHSVSDIKILHVDAVDCISKATSFHKLVDDGWVKSYQAKLNRKKQTDKIIPLQQIVLTKYITQHSDVDIQSAANAIECELIAESHQAMYLLKSQSRLSKTFAEWISKHLSGELKIPVC